MYIVLCTYHNQREEKDSFLGHNSEIYEVAIKNIISHTTQQKIGSAYAQSSQKCSNIEILVKIERKENFCYRILTKVM